MSARLHVFFVVIVLINVITFIAFCVDKRKAVMKSRNRIPERVLLSLAFYGGSLGAMLGMEIARHKTGDDPNNSKDIFYDGIPTAYVAQFLLLYFSPYWKNIFYILAAILYLIIASCRCLTWRSNHARQNAAKREAMQQARTNGSYTPREPMNFNSGGKNNSDT